MSRMRLKILQKEAQISQIHLNRIANTICVQLNYPKNLVGLEGKKKHHAAWDVWFDGFIDLMLDAANIGGREAFWNAGDRIALRKLIVLLVQHKAGSIRNHLRKGTLPGWMGGESTAYPPPTFSADIRGDSHTDDSDTEDPEESESEADPPTDPSPTTKSRLDEIPAKKRRKTDPAAPTFALQRSVTFLTRLQIPDTDVVRHEFVDTVGIVTLASFTKLLRMCNGMLPEQRIKGFEVEIGGRTVDVDMDDPGREWEWGLVLGILHFSGVPEGQKAYVDVRVESGLL